MARISLIDRTDFAFDGFELFNVFRLAVFLDVDGLLELFDFVQQRIELFFLGRFVYRPNSGGGQTGKPAIRQRNPVYAIPDMDIAHAHFFIIIR